MNMKLKIDKDISVHTCNECNKTFRQIYIKNGTLNQKIILLQWNSKQRSKLCRVPHTNFLTMLKVYKIFLVILKDVIHFLHILPGYTTKRCAVIRNSLNSQSVKLSVVQQDKNIKHNTRQINYVCSKYWMVTDNKCHKNYSLYLCIEIFWIKKN